MSETPFRCPECRSTFVECGYLDVASDTLIELECSRCGHTWHIVGAAEDFQRL